jgi:hypothetical protein
MPAVTIEKHIRCSTLLFQGCAAQLCYVHPPPADVNETTRDVVVLDLGDDSESPVTVILVRADGSELHDPPIFLFLAFLA